MKNKVKKLLEMKVLYENDERFIEEMQIVDKLLEYAFMSENKFTKLVSAGKIAAKDVRRVQQYRGGADKLASKVKNPVGDPRIVAKRNRPGIIKTKEEWINGVNKGTDNIIKKNGAKHVDVPNHGVAVGYGQDGGGKPFTDVYLNSVNKKAHKLFASHSIINPYTNRSTMHSPIGVEKKNGYLKL